MAKEVRKSDAKQYLMQAEEFLESAKENINCGRYNAAGFNAIQSIINANDALTIYFLEKRASADHREAIKLHIDVVRIIGDSSQRNTIKNALEERSAVGYLGKPISKNLSRKLVRSTTSFIEWVKRYLK